MVPSSEKFNEKKEKEPSRKRTFKVCFDDDEVSEKRFDDDQFNIQWKIIEQSTTPNTPIDQPIIHIAFESGSETDRDSEKITEWYPRIFGTRQNAIWAVFHLPTLSQICQATTQYRCSMMYVKQRRGVSVRFPPSVAYAHSVFANS
jgi:hypothetical protein